MIVRTEPRTAAPVAPSAPSPGVGGLLGTITVDEDRCKGCGLCVTVCPKHVIALADRFTPRGYHPAALIASALDGGDARCTGCMLCSTICPDAAITVYRTAPARRGR